MPKSLNLSPVSFEKWLELVFDHPVLRRLPGGEFDSGAQWHWAEEFHISDRTRLVTHMTRFCREFRTISQRFSLRQIDQGIWFLLGSDEDRTFGVMLADPEIELETRLNCARAMLHPYSNYAARTRKELDVSCFEMWWDMLCSWFWSAHLNRIKDEEVRDLMAAETQDVEHFLRVARFWSEVEIDRDLDEQLAEAGLTQADVETGLSAIEISYEEIEPNEQCVADAMLETLTQILYLEEQRCEFHALHGLNHLKHPRGAQVIQTFINQHKARWSKSWLAYAESCRDGKAM